MQIIINGKHEVLTWCIVGSFDSGIDCVIPDSVLNDNPLSYKYIDGEFIKNPDYKPPTPPETEKTVDQQIEEIQSKIDELNLSVDLLVLNSL